MFRLLAALIVAAGLPLAAAAQEEPADTVRLRFGWAPGMRADVEYQQVRVRNTDGQRDSVRMAATYRLETEAHPQGLLVRYADMRWTELPRFEGPVGRFFEVLSRTSSAARPRYLVSAGGEFLRLEGVQQMAEELRAAIQPIMAEMEGEAVAAFRNLVETTFSEEGMAAAAQTEWVNLVAAWVNADLEVEGIYTLDDSFESPLFPGIAIPLQVEFEVLGRVPCTEGGNASGCTELFTASVPDRDALQEAIGGFMQQAGVSEQEAADVLAQLEVETFVTLVTEPGTLRPWYMETVKVVSGGDDAPPLQQETETYRFRWR